jgi:hypothetical protein
MGFKDSMSKKELQTKLLLKINQYLSTSMILVYVVEIIIVHASSVIPLF